ncbi:MAG: hypothetical protein J6A97_06350 [Clostridia bacterium]|nr:hypothetical protein [Clostridia bacterium]
MKNNSSQSRFGKITAKAIVMLLAVVLSLSVLPALSADILPDASAATEYVVQSGETITNINNTLASYSAGTVVNMQLSATIDLDSQNHNSGIEIPKDITVNLYLNGNNISYERTRDNNSLWQFTGVYGIVNYGTLNVYAGSSSSPYRAVQSGKSSIIVKNIRNDMKSSGSNEYAYGRAEAIQNHGTLTVNQGVSLVADVQLKYIRTATTGQYDRDGSSTVAVAGVFNATDTATAVLDDVSISANASTSSANADYVSGHRLSVSNSYAYGVYGGNTNVSGTTAISVSATTGCDQNGGANDRKDGRTTAVAYGICTTKNVTVTGGTFSYSASDYNKANSLTEGTRHVYIGGICYAKDGTAPVLIDGNVKVATSDAFTGENDENTNGGTRVYRESTVALAEKMPWSPADVFGSTSGNLYSNPKGVDARPSGIAVGSFSDEVGNAYAASSTSTVGGHPTALNRGALSGQNRVHVVYRYWTDSTRTRLDTSIVDDDGNAGYSFRPTTSKPTVVSAPAVFSTFLNTKLTVGNNTAIRYTNGGDPCNHYYWNLYKISYQAAGTTFFSDFSMTQKGTEFQTFEATGATNGQANVTSGPVFIYVDYISKAPSAIKATVGTAGVVTTTYTGSNILASDLGLQIIDSLDEVDITKEYNIDFTDNSLIGVQFSFTGKNTADVEISDTGRLPRNAGTYQVTLQIAESVTYNTDPTKSKNRKALEYTFTLIVEQAEALRGTLPESFNDVVYGQKLNEIISVGTGTYKAAFLGKDNVDGTFSFVNAGDGSAYKNAGSGITQIKWTPAYGEGALEKNYKETVFSVAYTVKKAPLTITPNAATVVYGESDVAFSSVVSGLVANDNTENNQNIIKDALVYAVYFGGDYIAYQPGKIAVGSHVIRTSFTALPEILANYEYVHVYGAENNPNGVLKVTPRPLTVEATAQDRAYIPDNFDVNVSFTIVSGKFGTDDVRVTNATGALNENCDAGQLKIVNGISAETIKDKLAGSAKNNYEIVTVTYKTGENLLVNISKAIPDATVPTIAEMNYLQKRTLADVALGTTTSTVEGSWQWVDSTINPTVKVSQYKAQFVPVENQLKNYEIKVVDVAINVKPTPVTVGYSATVSYGDNVPNITNYTYTSDIDKDFDIKKVTTSGNITPRTDYQKGSPVKAGGYAVTITAPNYVDVDGNYIFTVNNGIINVNPRLITFTVEDKTIVYGDSFNVDSTGAVNLTFDESLLVGTDTINSITASGTAPVFSFETNFNSFDQYDAGTYTINATCTSTTSANYTVAVKAGTLHVTKAPLVIKANDFTLEYGSDVPANLDSALTLIGAKRNEKLADMISGEKTVSVNTSYTKGSPVKAGGYEVTVGIAGVSFPNYEVTVQNGTITVVKATPVITTLPTATITYGETLADAKFSGAVIVDNIPGAFVYDSPTVAPAYNELSYNSFTASFIPEDTDNYNVVRGKIISLTVGKKKVTGILSVAGIPMINEDLTADVTGLDPATQGSYTFVWYYEDGTVIGTGAELPLGADSANKKVYVKATAATPYEGTVESNRILIAPELTDINGILTETEYSKYFQLTGLEFGKDSPLQYNAQQRVVTFKEIDSSTANYEIGNIQVKYNGSAEAPVNVGRYAITVDIAAPENLTGLTYNDTDKVWVNADGAVVYSPVSNYLIGYLEITPMGYTVYVTVDKKVYDGTVDATAKVTEQIGRIELGGGEFDDVWFDNDAVTYYFETPDAGENKIVNAFGGDCLKGAAAGNYELAIVIENANSAVITPMPLEVTVSAVEREYIKGNKNVDLAFDFTPAEGDDGFVYVDASKAKGVIDTDIAGSHFVTVSDIMLIGDKAANYTLSIKDADKILAVITKAVPSYPIPEVHEVLYYNSGRHLSSISLGDSHWTWVDRNAVPGAGVHTFKAVYTPDDQANYLTVEYDVAVEVLKTPVTITAASFTITYGDIEPTYYYIAEGLTGADTIENAVDGYVLMNCNYHPGSNVGEYAIQLDGAFESDNYDFIYNNGVVTVGKRTAYVDVIAENREYKEGDTTVQVKFSPLENLYSGDSASDVYLQYTNYITGTVADANAGTKTVQYVMPNLLGTKAGNYVISPKKAVVTVEILKATIPGVILPTSGKVYYGNKLSTIEFTSSSEGGQFGTFTMENPTSTPEKVGTFANTYKVVFTPADTKNYATVSQYITVEVLPAFINVSVHFTGTIQVGKTLYAILNDVPAEALPNLVYEWYRVDTPESDPRTGIKVASNTDSYRLTEEDEGKYIMCAVTNLDGSPYECNAICVTDIAVEEQQLTLWQKFINWFYRLLSNFTQIFGGLLG